MFAALKTFPVCLVSIERSTILNKHEYNVFCEKKMLGLKFVGNMSDVTPRIMCQCTVELKYHELLS